MHFVQILAVTGSHSTYVVHYLRSQTDDGSMGNDRTLNTQTDGRQLKDDGLTEDRTDNKGQMTGRMRDGQTVQLKNHSLVYRSIAT